MAPRAELHCDDIHSSTLRFVAAWCSRRPSAALLHSLQSSESADYAAERYASV
jgi:hypothetical protein